MNTTEMDYLKLCVGERFEHDMPAEGMSIVLANGTPLLTFNFSASPREIQGFMNGNTSRNLQNSINRAELVARTAKKEK